MIGSPEQKEKSILAGLIAFGVLAVVLGIANLGRLIQPPRASGTPPSTAIPSSFEALAEQSRQALAALDTDKDGLTDLRELEETRTSPFLADSDSDGRSDGDEIAAGEDPNCPAGKECAATPAVNPVAEPIRPVVRQGSPAGTDAPAVVAPDPQALRAALAANGVPVDVLNALSDSELQASYGSASGAVSGSTKGSPEVGRFLSNSFRGVLEGRPGDPTAYLDNLPKEPGAIREYLRQGGFPAEQLVALDDAALLSVWNDVLASFRVHPK